MRGAGRTEWMRVRDLRLRALADAPDAFGSTLEIERGYEEGRWRELIEGWEGSVNALFVAEEQGAWVGMAVGSRQHREPDAHLYAMWVDPTWRARGVGARLVDEVLAWSASWGARSVILNVTETNRGAAAFYERMGFADTGQRHALRQGSDLLVRVLQRRL